MKFQPVQRPALFAPAALSQPFGEPPAWGGKVILVGQLTTVFSTTVNSRSCVQFSHENSIKTFLTVVLSGDNTLYRFINPSFSSLANAALSIIAATIPFSETFLSVVKVFLDVVGVIVIDGVEPTTVVASADGFDGCAFSPVFPAEDNCGVRSVRALYLDVIRVAFFDCCRDFLQNRTVRQHHFQCCRGCCRGRDYFTSCPFVKSEM